MKLLLLIIITAVLEIALLIKVGGWIGFFPTMGIIIVTAMVGLGRLKLQGASMIQQLAASREDPSKAMLEGVVVMISSLFLILPGFITDGLGLMGLIPAIRRKVVIYFQSQSSVLNRKMGASIIFGQPVSESDDLQEVNRDYSSYSKTEGSEHRQQTNKPHQVIEGEFERKEDES